MAIVLSHTNLTINIHFCLHSTGEIFPTCYVGEPDDNAAARLASPNSPKKGSVASCGSGGLAFSFLRAVGRPPFSQDEVANFAQLGFFY
jgi:hypothetical protein